MKFVITNKIIFVLLLITWRTTLTAQSTVIRGIVSDSQGPICYADILLISLDDPSICRSSRTDSLGFYQFVIEDKGSYKLRVSALGYKNFESEHIFIDSQITYPIRLKEQHVHWDEVEIIGNSVSEKKGNTALNIAIVSQSYLEQNRGGSLVHSIERLPGISMIGIGSGQAKPMIRGMGFDRLLVIDKGVKHEAQQWGVEHGLEIDQFAVNQLEIIKGPASFLYGSNAIGGVIKINPEPPPIEDTIGGEVELTGRSNNAWIGTSLKLYGRKKKWVISGGFSYQDYGDYKVPVDTVNVYDYPVRLHGRRVRNTAGKQAGMHFNTGYYSDTYSTVFYISDVYSKNGFFANAHGLEPRRVDANLYDQSDRDIQEPGDQVNHFKIINRSIIMLNNHLIRIEGGFQNNFRQEFFNYVPHGYMPVFYPDTLDIDPNLERQYDKNVFSINLSDQLNMSKHSVHWGFSGEYQKNRIDGYGFLVPSFDQKNIGVFGYDKFQLTDRVLLHTALRYDYTLLNTYSYMDWFETPIDNNGIIQTKQIERSKSLIRNYNSITGALGFNYHLNDYAIKVHLGKSYRTPIAKELSANGVNYHYFSFEMGNNQLKPEESYQFDFSLNYAKKKVAYEISPFVNYFPNYIYLNPTPYYDYLYGGGNQIYQYSQSRVFRAGGEFSIKYYFDKSLSAEMSGDYVYSIQLSGDKKGYTLPFSPPISSNINITYSLEQLARFYHPYFSVDTRLVAAQSNIVPPEKKTKGYALIHIQSGGYFYLGKQTVNVNFQVRNLLNTPYMTHTGFYRLIALPEEGVNFVLSVRMTFDFKNNKK